MFPEFPARFNLFATIGGSSFYNTPEGIKALKNYKTDKYTLTFLGIIAWLGLIASVYYLFTHDHPIWSIIATVVGFPIALGISKIQPNNRHLAKKTYDHCRTVAQAIVTGYFPDAAWFSYRTEALVYNNNICVYFSTTTGELVLYKKGNIKEVYREHLQIGSSVSGSGYGYGYTGNIKPYYEWHFDILTDFLDYPKVSFVLPDDEFTNNEIAKAYAILKP